MNDLDPLAGRKVMIIVNTDWYFLTHRQSLALAARAAGADVIVVATDTGRSYDILEVGLAFEDARMSRTAGNPLTELRTLGRLWRLLRRHRPDVVHLVATKAIVYGGLAAWAAGVRGVVSAVTGAGYALGEGRHAAVQHLVRALLRVVLRRSSVVVFQIEHDRDLYVGHGLVRRDRTKLVRGVGVDPEEWTVEPDVEEPVVMLASRLIAEKGVETFAEAARYLRAEFQEVRFVIVGKFDLDLPSVIPRALVEGWIADGLVEWWGHRTDMHAVLASCRVFVFPSYHNEGVPKVLLEAAATGRAVVASDIPGCRAVIEDGVTGLLVPPRDPVRLAEAVGTLLRSPERRRELASAARADVSARFRESDLTAQMLDAYRAALSGA